MGKERVRISGRRWEDESDLSELNTPRSCDSIEDEIQLRTKQGVMAGTSPPLARRNPTAVCINCSVLPTGKGGRTALSKGNCTSNFPTGPFGREGGEWTGRGIQSHYHSTCSSKVLA